MGSVLVKYIADGKVQYESYIIDVEGMNFLLYNTNDHRFEWVLMDNCVMANDKVGINEKCKGEYKGGRKLW